MTQRKTWDDLTKSEKLAVHKATQMLYTGALHFGEDTKMDLPKRKPRKKRQHLEQDYQIKLVAWIKSQGLPINASAAGGKRNKITGRILKLMGVSKGYPDLTIDLANKTYHGLKIELKIDSGRPSEEQLEWQTVLRKNGYCCEFVYGLEEGKNLITKYINDQW